MSILEAKNLSFTYSEEDGKGEEVLHDVSLSVEEGSFVAILGHNGCGKSTLAKHFNGILLPCGGEVYAIGMSTSEEKNIPKLRKNVGMVFQNPDNQIIATVVEEDVAFALENLGVPHDEMEKRVSEALDIVDMLAFRKHAPHLLSGGQKQRVAIAGIIAMRPRVLILDEPTAMLDPKGRKEVMHALHRLNRQEGITVLLITHYMDEAVQADRVVVMNEGKVLLDDTPAEVFQNIGLLQSVALDVPQSAELMYQLRHEDVKVPLSVLTDQECVEVLADLLEGKYGDYRNQKFNT
ncbi:MAG: energy-coupling factor transporter ATPase [Clostridia bacterium]|nr:energy-coupling factor transporter ATPase [Clostridia bacterium]